MTSERNTKGLCETTRNRCDTELADGHGRGWTYTHQPSTPTTLVQFTVSCYIFILDFSLNPN